VQANFRLCGADRNGSGVATGGWIPRPSHPRARATSAPNYARVRKHHIPPTAPAKSRRWVPF